MTIPQRHRQTGGRTDGWTTCRGNTALCVAAHGKNCASFFGCL